MDNLPFIPSSYDLIWAEGSIIILGAGHGMTSWKKFLKPDGFLGFTEVTGVTTAPSENVRSFLQENYPDMKTVDEVKTLASRAGYTSIAEFSLPSPAW
jgi:hypothetical protein